MYDMIFGIAMVIGSAVFFLVMVVLFLRSSENFDEYDR